MKPVSLSYRWWALTLATGCQTTATLITYGVGPLSYYWQQAFGLTQMEAGLLLSVVNVGPLLSMLFVGHLLDRYGERWVIGLGAMLIGLSTMASALMESYLSLLFLLTLVGFFYGTAQPGGSKVVMEWFSPKERGLAMGIRQAGIPIGGALGGAIIPFLAETFHWTWAVVTISLLALGSGVAFLTFYRPSTKAPNTVSSSFWRQIGTIARHPRLASLFFIGVAMVSLQMVLVGHWMFFVARKSHLTGIEAGAMVSILLFSGMAGRILLAWASDRFLAGNRLRPLQWVLWISCGTILLLPFLPAKTPLVAWGMISAWIGFFGVGWYSLFMVQVAEWAPRESTGLTVGFALTVNQMAIMAAPAVFGWLVDLWGMNASWGALLFFMAASGLALRNALPRDNCPRHETQKREAPF